MKLILLSYLLLIISCTAKHRETAAIAIPDVKLEATDTALKFKNGVLYYKDQLFSGITTDRYEDESVHHTTPYYNGKQEGWQTTWFNNNILAEKRYYHLGEKDSVHSGWWPNGNKRFEYHFKEGVYNGDFKEWYEQGQPLKVIYYTKGMDDSGKGWRQNGKLYMNFIVKNGRRYGINNSNLCYTVKNGNGEYVESADSADATRK